MFYETAIIALIIALMYTIIRNIIRIKTLPVKLKMAN